METHVFLYVLVLSSRFVGVFPTLTDCPIILISFFTWLFRIYQIINKLEGKGGTGAFKLSMMTGEAAS